MVRDNARRPAVISSPPWAVSDVDHAGVLCAFSCVVDTLSVACLRRRPETNVLVVAIFRTQCPLPERSSATCQRRIPPGQLGQLRGGLQITAVMRGNEASAALRFDAQIRRFGVAEAGSALGESCPGRSAVEYCLPRLLLIRRLYRRRRAAKAQSSGRYARGDDGRDGGHEVTPRSHGSAGYR